MFEGIVCFQRKGKKDKNDTVNDTVKEDEILRLIKISNKISARRIAKETEYSIATAKRYMAKPKEKGKLKRIGPDKGGYWEMRNAN
ncbi:MAG: hypothetical protein LRZ93_04970 [Clostridiales bacterium]|nr:hypothetical protein [Clostridiales bacterium]